MDKTTKSVEDQIKYLHTVLEASEKKLSADLNFDTLKQEVRDSLRLDEFVLQEEAMNNTSKHHEIIVQWFEMQDKQSYYRRYEKVLYKLLYDWYKYECPTGPFRTKEDYNRHIYAHETWVLLKRIQDQVDQITNYLSYVEKLFGSRNFSIGAVSRLLGN